VSKGRPQQYKNIQEEKTQQDKIDKTKMKKFSKKFQHPYLSGKFSQDPGSIV